MPKRLSDMVAYEYDAKRERAIETYDYHINGEVLTETSVRPSPLPCPTGDDLRRSYEANLHLWLDTQVKRNPNRQENA